MFKGHVTPAPIPVIGILEVVREYVCFKQTLQFVKNNSDKEANRKIQLERSAFRKLRTFFFLRIPQSIKTLDLPMYNVLGMQVVHALRRLPCHVDEVQQREGRLQHVQVLVQGGALAPLRHDGQRGLGHAAHE